MSDAYNDAKWRMVNAITIVLVDGRREDLEDSYYDGLSNDELLAYGKTLWDFHTDLRDEYARRMYAQAILSRERGSEESDSS